MSQERHLMVCTEGNGAQSYFECTVDGCGRELIFDHVEIELMILSPGDESALHQGSTGLVALSGAMRPGEAA
ncbi:MAG TPA: hypothetical protein VE442_24600 [Jatrophihabitans sp.]|nr:hypothetical protein [Jatrophihabitans sp.]